MRSLRMRKMVGLGNPIARVNSSSVGGSSAAAICSSTANARSVADSRLSAPVDIGANFTERNSMFHYCKVFGCRAMMGRAGEAPAGRVRHRAGRRAGPSGAAR